MSRRTAVLVVGVALFVLGMMWGFVPVAGHAAEPGHHISCGSAFVVNHGLSSAERRQCETQEGLGKRRVWALGYLAAGVVMVVGASIAGRHRNAEAEADSGSNP